MNILYRELKTRWFKSFIWLVGLSFFMVMAFVEFKAMKEAGPALSTFMDNIPTILKSVFGFNDVDLASTSGYMSIVGIYTLLLLSVYSLFLGISVINVEADEKTSDFLLTKPLSRGTIFQWKVFGGAILITLVNGLLFFVTLGIASNIVTENINDILLNYSIGYFSVSLFMFSLGILLATYFPKKSSSIGLMIILFFYIYPVLIDMSGLNPDFKKFSIFSMFDFSQIPMIECAVLLFISLILRQISKYGYQHRDIL